MPTITLLQPHDAPAVRSLIHTVWQEFNDPGDPNDEPDLRDLPGSYTAAASRFWTAHASRPSHLAADSRLPVTVPHLIGTLALQDLGHSTAALKRMYVLPNFRGAPHHTGTLLLQAALTHARAHGLHTLVLGTMSTFTRAQAFYRKHNFHPIPPSALPPNFPRDPADTLFFALHLTSRD